MYSLGQQPGQLVSYYDILRVEPGASEDEIKAAYHRLAKRFHPDRVPSPDARTRRMAEMRFRLINEAYATLKAKDKRERYNRQLRSQMREVRKIAAQPRNDNRKPRPAKNKSKGFFGALFSDLFTPTAPAETRESR